MICSHEILIVENKKLTFEQNLGPAKESEVWNFLTTKVDPSNELRTILASPNPDHHVVAVNYWHKSKDQQEHLTVTKMYGIFAESFAHVYRDGQVKEIDEGRGHFRTVEKEVGPDGKVKNHKVWRFMDGGKPVTSETLKEEWEMLKGLFD